MDIEAILKNPTVKKAFFWVVGLFAVLFLLRFVMHFMLFNEIRQVMGEQQQSMQSSREDFRKHMQESENNMKKEMGEMDKGIQQMEKKIENFHKDFAEGAAKVQEEIARAPEEMREFREKGNQFVLNAYDRDHKEFEAEMKARDKAHDAEFKRMEAWEQKHRIKMNRN